MWVRVTEDRQTVLQQVLSAKVKNVCGAMDRMGYCSFPRKGPGFGAFSLEISPEVPLGSVPGSMEFCTVHTCHELSAPSTPTQRKV